MKRRMPRFSFTSPKTGSIIQRRRLRAMLDRYGASAAQDRALLAYRRLDGEGADAARLLSAAERRWAQWRAAHGGAKRKEIDREIGEIVDLLTPGDERTLRQLALDDRLWGQSLKGSPRSVAEAVQAATRGMITAHVRGRA